MGNRCLGYVVIGLLLISCSGGGNRDQLDRTVVLTEAQMEIKIPNAWTLSTFIARDKDGVNSYCISLGGRESCNSSNAFLLLIVPPNARSLADKTIEFDGDIAHTLDARRAKYADEHDYHIVAATLRELAGAKAFEFQVVQFGDQVRQEALALLQDGRLVYVSGQHSLAETTSADQDRVFATLLDSLKER